MQEKFGLRLFCWPPFFSKAFVEFRHQWKVSWEEGCRLVARLCHQASKQAQDDDEKPLYDSTAELRAALPTKNQQIKKDPSSKKSIDNKKWLVYRHHWYDCHNNEGEVVEPKDSC